MDSNFTTVNGIKIHYKSNFTTENNSKPVFIFIHGASTKSQHTDWWKSLNERIISLCNPVYIDGYGHGKSSKPAENELINFDTHLEIYRELLTALIKKYNLNSFILIGRSLGGNIVHKLSSEFSDYLTAIGLIAPSGARNTKDTLEGWSKNISVLWDSNDPVVGFNSYSTIEQTVDQVKLFVIGNGSYPNAEKVISRENDKSPSHAPELQYPELFELFLKSLL